MAIITYNFCCKTDPMDLSIDKRLVASVIVDLIGFVALATLGALVTSRILPLGTGAMTGFFAGSAFLLGISILGAKQLHKHVKSRAGFGLD